MSNDTIKGGEGGEPLHSVPLPMNKAIASIIIDLERVQARLRELLGFFSEMEIRNALQENIETRLRAQQANSELDRVSDSVEPGRGTGQVDVHARSSSGYPRSAGVSPAGGQHPVGRARR